MVNKRCLMLLLVVGIASAGTSPALDLRLQGDEHSEHIATRNLLIIPPVDPAALLSAGATLVGALASIGVFCLTPFGMDVQGRKNLFGRVCA